MLWWLALLGGIYLIIVLSKSLYQLYGAKNRLTEAEMRLEEMQKKTEELTQTLDETQTADFIEKEARDKLNMQKLGEVVLIVPEVEIATTEAEKVVEERNNVGKWLKVFSF